MTEPLISADRVEAILLDCLSEDDPNPVLVEGIIHNYGFTRAKLDEHRPEIEAMLRCLPMPFRPTSVGGGGGWSFLNACDDVAGMQWTGLHWTMEKLMCLGIACDVAAWTLPRDMWVAFPGGMPYVSVKV